MVMAVRRRKSKIEESKKVLNLLRTPTKRIVRRGRRRITTTRAIIHDFADQVRPRRRQLAAETVSTTNRKLQQPWWEEISSTDLAKLPPELVIQIVARMSPSICFMVNTFPSSWLAIMTDPLFLSQNLGRRPPVSLIVCNTHVHPNQLTLVQKDPALDKFVSSNLQLEDFRRTNACRLVNSCNGLMCYSTSDKTHKETYYLSNPLTAEWVMLPYPDPRIFESEYAYTGFGYCPNTNQYKLVRMRCPKHGQPRLMVEVYTVGTCDGWRRIENDTIFQIFRFNNSTYIFMPPVAFNGVLHWLFTSDCIDFQVFCFDVGTEQYLGSFPLPNTDEPIEQIGVLNGYFFTWSYKRYSSPAKYCQIWILKDYYVTDSWVKLGEYSTESPFTMVQEIIDVDEDGKKALMVHDSGQLSYGYEAKRSIFNKSMTIKSVSGIVDGKSIVRSFVPSFLSPKHLLQQQQRLDHH